MSFYDFLMDRVGDDDAIAVIDPTDQAWSYGQLRSAVAHLSGFVAEQSAPGDRCALSAGNSLFWIAVYLAIIRARRVVVPIPVNASPERVRDILLSCTPAIGFAEGDALRTLHENAGAPMLLVSPEASDLPRHIELDVALAMLPMDGAAAIDASAPAAIFYTAGKSADPRGVVLTHGNLTHHTQLVEDLIRLTDCDRLMCPMPLSSSFAASMVHAHLRAGASTVLGDPRLQGTLLLDRLGCTACSGLIGTTALYQNLLNGHRAAQRHFPHLRYLQHTGSRPPGALVEALREAFPAQQIHLVYSLTEATAHVAALPPEQLGQDARSVGKPLPGIELKIVDRAGAALPAGETGEIVLRGATVSPGYWRNSSNTGRTFRDGSLHTGDLGTMDEHGNLHIVGRAEDFLELGQQRVPVAEIEQVVSGFPGVVEVAATSRVDDALGEVVVLFVTHLRGEAAMRNLVDYCARKLPFGHRPREFHFRARLPHDAAGRIDRARLQDELRTQEHASIFLERAAGADALQA